MDARYNLQDLSGLLAKRLHIAYSESEDFVRGFFDVISRYLIQEKIVKVKGLGTFKLIDVLDRESIDVNTGERIVIGGHVKVTFTPDTTLRDQVNKPFIDFETVIINEGTDLAAMEDLGEAEKENVQEEGEAEVEPEHSEESEEPENQEASLNEPLPSGEDTPSDVEDIVEKGESVSGVDLARQEALDILQRLDRLERLASIENQAVQDNQNRANGQEGLGHEEVQEHSESRQALESAPLEPDLVAGEEMQPETEKKTVDPSVELPASSSADSSVSSEVAAHHRRKNRHVWMWLLVTIVLMTMSYYAGYYRILCPCLWHCDNRVQLEDTVAGRSVPMVALVPAEKVNQKVNDTLETTEQVKPDSMPKADNPSKPVVSAQQIQRYPQVPGGKYLIVGQLAVHPMRVGDNLYKISRKYYGHYEGVKYINCLNNFTNPDVIQPGYKIKIPRLEKVQ